MNSAHQRFKVISHMIMIMKGIYSFTQKKKKETAVAPTKRRARHACTRTQMGSQKRTSICIVHIPLFDS